MKINYLANWGGVPEKAWSGTYWSIHEALKRNGVEIKDFSLKGEGFVLKNYHRVLRRLGLCGRNLGTKEIEKTRKQFQFLRENEDCTVFQFTDNVMDSSSCHTFVYVDLTFPTVVALNKSNCDFRRYGGYGNVDERALFKRTQLQLEYMKTCSGVFTMGNWLAERLVKEEGIPADRVFHVGAGSNMHLEMIDESKKEHRRLLFVGRDFERKGLHVVYDAFKILREHMPNAELYVAGPKKNPISNPIGGYYYVGDAPYNEVAKLYNLCDVFCMPSYFEAYGLVFVEALTFGLPCIGRNAWEMPYFIEDGKTGALIDDDNPEVLAEKMYTILNDHSYQKNVQQRREQYIRDYSWDAVAQRMINIMF